MILRLPKTKAEERKTVQHALIKNSWKNQPETQNLFLWKSETETEKNLRDVSRCTFGEL
jgi:hypothetical protein